MDDDEPGLPDELASLLEQLGGPGAVDQVRRLLAAHPGPVNWDLARQVSVHLAAPGDRPPNDTERDIHEEAQRLAEHWLDEGSLPAPPDAGKLAIVSRQAWVSAALDGLRPLIEPVAEASIRALGQFMDDQLREMGPGGPLDETEVPPAGIEHPSAMLGPVGGFLMGMQTGQVVGELARQMLGQYELGIPTADRATAYRIAVNVAETFDGYDLEAREVAVVLALHEGAARRQYHAVPWLGDHLWGLVETFAAGTEIDADHLLEVSRELMIDVDPEDPESLQEAIQRAGEVRLEPTARQRRVLERIQGVVCLLQAWARLEVRTAAEQRLPNVGRVEEVLRRRRATQSDGERLLATLLGLDLKPEDESVGDRFVAAVRDARGLAGLRRALAHPENLPDSEELAEPSSWLVRMAGGEDVPDDASQLFAGLGEAPVEPPGDERGPSDPGDG